jgi:hypothetical protein
VRVLPSINHRSEFIPPLCREPCYRWEPDHLPPRGTHPTGQLSRTHQTLLVSSKDLHSPETCLSRTALFFRSPDASRHPQLQRESLAEFAPSSITSTEVPFPLPLACTSSPHRTLPKPRFPTLDVSAAIEGFERIDQLHRTIR